MYTLGKGVGDLTSGFIHRLLVPSEISDKACHYSEKNYSIGDGLEGKCLNPTTGIIFCKVKSQLNIIFCFTCFYRKIKR